MPYSINNKEFTTKDKITEYCRDILNKYPDGKNLNTDDSQFLFELFKFHDEWDIKSDGGVLHISTQTTEHGTRCFILKKNNGISVDISFRHSIKLISTKRSKNSIPQGLKNFKDAARTAIKIQIDNFRDNNLLKNTRCPLTNECLHKGNSNIDHIPPNTFDQLLFDFCLTQKINPLKIDVLSINGVIAEFSDNNLSQDWQKYHQTHAKLRIISKRANLRLSKINNIQWSDLY